MGYRGFNPGKRDFFVATIFLTQVAQTVVRFNPGKRDFFVATMYCAASERYR